MGLRGVSYRGVRAGPPPSPVKSVQSIRSRYFKSGLGMLDGGFWCLVWWAVFDFPDVLVRGSCQVLGCVIGGATDSMWLRLRGASP